MIPSRIGWASLAAAAAGAVYLAASLLVSVDEGSERTDQLQQQLEATPPATAGDLRELGEAVDELRDAPPVVITTTAVPGPPGATGPAGVPGSAGSAGAVVVRTVTAAPAAPSTAPVVTRTAQPRPAAPPASPTPAPTASPSTSSVPCDLVAFLAGGCQAR